jgi:hypothetical protein
MSKNRKPSPAAPAPEAPAADKIDTTLDALLGDAPEAPEIVDAKPEPGPEPDLDRPVGEIAELPPEGEGERAFQTVTMGDINDDVLSAFPPPPPLPPLADAVAAQPDAPQSQPVPAANTGSFFHSERLAADTPPNIVPAAPEPPPSLPSFDHLPERTRLELEAGRRAIRADHVSLRDAVEAKAEAHPTSNLPLQPDPSQEEKPLDYSKLSPQTRAELEGGAESLRRKDVEYREAVKLIEERGAQRLAENAPAEAGDLDYLKR